MKPLKTALIYGSIAGLIMTTSWWLFNLFFDDLSLSNQEIIGYAAMIIALSTVFIGVKKFRDSSEKDEFSFKEGFLIGLYIVLVASAIYVIGWMIYYPNFMPDFTETYAAGRIEEYRASGLSEVEIQEKEAELSAWMETYENPFVMAGITFMEIFPVGLVVSLIAAAILRKKPE